MTARGATTFEGPPLDGFADTDTPGEIGMVLPQAGLDALGPVWWWSATVNVDGKDIDFCPDPA